MKQFCFLLPLLLFACGSTYAQDIYFSAYANGKALTANGTQVTGLPVPVGGGDANDYVEITSYQYSFSNSATIGTGTGKAVGSAIQLTKRLDVSTSNLLPYLFTSRRIASAELIIRRTGGGGNSETITMIELKDVILADYSSSASTSSGDCCPAEALSLVYSAIRITNYQQDQTGRVTAQTPVVWNFATNSATF